MLGRESTNIYSYRRLNELCLKDNRVSGRSTYSAQVSQKLVCQIGLLIVSNLFLLLLVTRPGVASHEQMKSTSTLVGTVVRAPNSPDGYGNWQIDVAKDQLYLFVANPDVTYFLSTIPKVGDVVSLNVSASPSGMDEIVSMMVVELVNTLPSTSGIDIAFVTFSGSILSGPPAENGIGTWQLFNQDGQIYDVEVHAVSAFTRGQPIIGQDVDVKGWRMAAKTVSAETVETADDTVHDKPTEQAVIALSGEVVGDLVDTDAEQEWYLRASATVYRVRSNAKTRFSPSLPQSGEYVQLLALIEDPEQPPLILEVTADTFVVGEILVRLQPDLDVTTLAARYRLIVDSTLLASGRIYRLVSPNPTVNYLTYLKAQLQSDPGVIWSEVNYVDELPIESHPHRIWGWGGQDDSSYINQEAFTQIKLGNVHDTYRGDGEIIAVLDTGVDLDHPSLQPQLLAGWDMVDDDATPEDEGPGIAQGHGTHVSGIVARVAPGSQILPVRVLDANGRGNSFVVAYAIEWAVQHGADVINLSEGTAEDSQLLHDIVAWAAEQGVSVVAASGNSNSSALHFPAAYPDTLAITAVDEAKTKATFANFGSWVDLAAPGVGITSTIVTAQGSGYAVWSGTSMATPFVSGALALLREKFPEKPLKELHQRLQTRSEVIDDRNRLYTGLVGTFLNIEASMQADLVEPPPSMFAVYVPMVILTDPATDREDPR